MHLGNWLNPNFPLLLPNFLSLLLSHLCHPDLNLLTRRGRESRRARMYCRLGDFALRLKKRPSSLPRSKRSDKWGREARKGEKVRHLSLRLGFQLQWSMVSPWGITHPSKIFMEVMDAMWPQLWKGLYCSPMTWPSYVLSRGMRFSLTSKDIWV